MKSKIKVGLVLLLGLFLFPLGYINNAQAAEMKEVLINQINMVNSDTLTYTATTGGRLEIIVPLAYANQNENWSVSLEGNNYYKTGKYSSYDVMEDKTVLVAYVPTGTYVLDFSGKAVCQINFIVDSINDEVESNDSFDAANQLYANIDKKGEVYHYYYGNGVDAGYSYYDKDYFKLAINEKGLLQFQIGFEGVDDNTIEIYKEESNGNLIKIYSERLYTSEYRTEKFFTEAGNYYIKIGFRYEYGYWDNEAYRYTLRANFTSTANTLREIENNDVYTSATDIVTNVDYSGNLEDTEDIDYYRISLDQPQLAQVALKTVRQDTGSIFDITLYKKENNELKEVNKFVSGINNVIHQGESVYLEAGDYYIKVKKGSGSIDSVSLSEQDYQIQLTAKTISLSQPHISIQEDVFPLIKITSNEFDEFVTGMEVYEKVGNGEWSEAGISYGNEFYTNISELGSECTYRVRTFYEDEESGAIIYSDYSNEVSINIAKLKKPTVSMKRTNFNEITLSFKNVDTRAGDIVIYQKIGNGGWENIKTISSAKASNTIKIKTLGKKYSYRIKTSFGDYESDFSDVKSLTISSKLAKPTFTVTKKTYYGTPALYIKPTKYEYAQGVEIWSSINGKSWDYKGKLNLSESKGTYFYNLQKGRKYYIKMRSYRTFNGKKIYSPWTAVKKVVR